MTVRAKASSMLLAQMLAFLIPAFLGMYWIIYASNQSIATLLFRPLIVATSVALTLLLCYWAPISYAEKELVGVLAFVCFVFLAPSLAATDPVRALQAWLKLLIICAVSAMLCCALRHPGTAKIFGASLVIGSTALGAFIVATYVKNIGLVLPTYTATRVLKGLVIRSGIPLNPIAFECVFGYVCGMCLLRNAKFLWFLGLVLLAISSLLTGSRTPLAVVGVSGLMLLAINALRSRRLLVWFAGAILAAAMVVGAVFAITWSSPRELSTVTEGRWDLWTVAAHRFSERPLLGNGYLASEDDPTYIPGGYHSEYLTAFAEQGIVGFAAVLYLLWFLLRCCWSLAFRHSYTWHNGQWALFGCFFLLVRASVEVPGLFGYAQEPADFLAYAFLAIIVSRFSREEDYLRSATSLSPVVSASDRGIRTGRQPSMRTPTRNRRLLANLHEVPLS